MLEAFESLLPIVLMMAIGAVLLRTGFFSEAFRQGLDYFTYWVALPCLFVGELAGARFASSEAGWLTLVLAGATLAGAAVGLMGAGLLRLPRASTGVFVQASFRGNLVYVGLPIVIYAVTPEGNGVETMAILALAPLVPLYNVLAVVALLMARDGVDRRAALRLTWTLVTNPLIVACVVGGLLAWSGWGLPAPVGRTLKAVGQTAPALSLISLGGALVVLEWRGQLVPAVAAGLLKVAAVPLLTLALCWALRLPPTQTRVAMIFAACPTAVASYVMATQLHGDRALAASCVVVSTLLSLGALTAVLYLF